ncbi:MAG: NADH-quinone oxidoreductase subunit C [Pseudohongiellaceae bacterium]|jgi:NADH-quinone oxidoreductase subunit C
MSTMTDHGDPAAAAAVHDAFPNVTHAPEEFAGDMRVWVEPGHESEVLAWARSELGFDLFIDRFGADHGEDTELRFDVITVVVHSTTNRRLIFVTSIDEKTAEVPTLLGVFRGAGWYEREIYDMYGLTFAGHPNMTRILMPDRFTGWPMRKEYPMEGLGEFAAPKRALGGNVDGTDGKVAVPEKPGQPGAPTVDPIRPRDEDGEISNTKEWQP